MPRPYDFRKFVRVFGPHVLLPLAGRPYGALDYRHPNGGINQWIRPAPLTAAPPRRTIAAALGTAGTLRVCGFVCSSGRSDALLRPLPQDVPLLSAAPRVPTTSAAAPAHRPQPACRRHLAASQESGCGGGKREHGFGHRWPPPLRLLAPLLQVAHHHHADQGRSPQAFFGCGSV